MLKYLLPIVAGSCSYYAEIWPSWVSQEAGAICCLTPVLAMLFTYLFPDYDRFAQFLSGASYALLAGLAFAKAAEEMNLFSAGVGVIISCGVILAWFPEWVRNGTIFGLRNKNVFVFLLMSMIGFLCAMNDWSYPIFRVILPVGMIPLALGFLWELKWTKYFGAIFLLLAAAAMASDAAVDPNWLTHCIILIGFAVVFLRVDRTPNRFQTTRGYDWEEDTNDDP